MSCRVLSLKFNDDDEKKIEKEREREFTEILSL